MKVPFTRYWHIGVVYIPRDGSAGPRTLGYSCDWYDGPIHTFGLWFWLFQWWQQA